MNALERNVHQARRRLSLNRWIGLAGWCLVAAAGVWAAFIVVLRLWDLSLPLGWFALCAVAGALGAAAVWTLMSRLDQVTAAAALDEAAGLKERTSSGWLCREVPDPFAQAAVMDAERINQAVSPRSFIKLQWSTSMSYAVLATLLAVVVTWLPIPPLQSDAAAALNPRAEEITRQEVKRVTTQLQQLRQQMAKSELAKDLQSQLQTIDQLPEARLNTPVSTRREAIKNIDRIADSVRDKRDEQFDRMAELKRMFRGLKPSNQPQTPTSQLAKALSKSDFRNAKQAVNKMIERLAKVADQKNPEAMKGMKKELEQLARRLSEMAEKQRQDEELKKQLKQAGVDPETLKRALQKLTKEDLQKAKEQMKKQGASQQEIKELAKKLKSRQQASQQGSDLAQAMQKAAQAMAAQSSMSEASQQMQAIADQLNGMEQMQQQLEELNSMLSDAQAAQDQLASQNQSACSGCDGRGCGQCQGSGQKSGKGMGGQGQGRGGRGPEEQTEERFVKVRTKVITTEGSIIAKMFVDGEQVRGDISQDAVELITAAERDATDAVNNNQIPNLYKKAVKAYFSQIRSDFEGVNQSVEDAPAVSDDSPP